MSLIPFDSPLRLLQPTREGRLLAGRRQPVRFHSPLACPGVCARVHTRACAHMRAPVLLGVLGECCGWRVGIGEILRNVGMLLALVSSSARETPAAAALPQLSLQ